MTLINSFSLQVPIDRAVKQAVDQCNQLLAKYDQHLKLMGDLSSILRIPLCSRATSKGSVKPKKL